MKPKYWRGVVAECDLCHRQMHTVMYDAAIVAIGSWGLLCQACFKEEGCGLGAGRGQQYMEQPDGKWMKVAG